MDNMPSDEEMIEEIERQRAEGTDLDGLVPVKARTTKSPRLVFSIRLGQDELKAIEAAAESRGVSMGDFIRDSAMQAAAGEAKLAADADEYSLEALHTDIALIKRKLDQVVKRKAS